MDQAESERETEFGLMKEIMKKLVHALEDRAGADLIQANNAMNQAAAADTQGTVITEKPNAFTKRNGSMPPEVLDRTRNNLMQTTTKNNNFVLPSIASKEMLPN